MIKTDIGMLNTEEIEKVNFLLEVEGYYGWVLGYDRSESNYYLSAFDERNPRVELVFFMKKNAFEIKNGFRYSDSITEIKSRSVTMKEANEVAEVLNKKIFPLVL